MAEGLFLIRVVIGLLLIGHGTQKLFGWYGGHGLAGTGGFFESLGFTPGRRYARLAGLSEAGGGLLIVIGLLTPLGGAIIAGTMLVATLSVHIENGVWGTNGGYELPLTNGAVAIGLAFTGAGSWSIDRALRLPWTHGWGPGIVAFALAVFMGMLVNGSRRGDEPESEAYPAEQPVSASVSDAADVRR